MSTAAAPPAGDPTVRFAAHLIATGKLTAPALGRAWHSASQTGEQLIPLLSRLGLIPERTLAAELAAFHLVPPVSARDFPDQVLYDRASTEAFQVSSHPSPHREGRPPHRCDGRSRRRRRRARHRLFFRPAHPAPGRRPHRDRYGDRTPLR